MCFFGGGGSDRPKVAEYESKNDPVVVTGEQEGLEDTQTKNTAAETLKIKKQKQTKNFSNPTITTAQKLTKTKKKTLI
tara:strand:+ start:211 stop:444 length:234 start_codon:yes stop_codon:yes gene_type:complete